jgi:3',5'-cyclic AMP phosphodiesterase CpdA
MTPYRLAHVTDPHFRSFEGAHLGDFVGKRAVGALNLLVYRRRRHKMALLTALGDDLRAQAPDHVALTGDLSNVSLDAEWRMALQWLEGLGRSPEEVTVIPGNHDAYVPEVVEGRVFETLFARYQTAGHGRDGGSAAGDRPAPAPLPLQGYPFVRFRGPLALVSVNSCVATRGLGAWGRIGEDQLGRIEVTLGSAELRGRVRVVLIHHPPVRHKGVEDRNLRDREQFTAMLTRAGADLVLHGHDHEDEQARVPGPGGGEIPVIGAGSASYVGSGARRARYNIYEFDGAHITVVTRAHDEATGTVREVRRDRVA